MVRHKKEIIAALKNGGGNERRRVFAHWEEEYSYKFSRGERGYKLYCELIELVKMSSDEKAVEEFRQRFLPLCDKEVVAAALFKAFMVAGEDAERGEVKETPRQGLLRRWFGR